MIEERGELRSREPHDAVADRRPSKRVLLELRRAASPPIGRPRSRPKKTEHQCFAFLASAPILGQPHRRLASSRALCIAHQGAFGDCRSIAPIAQLNEQAFVTQAGQIAARNTNVGQVFRPDYPHLQSERDRAFSERWLRAPSQPDPLGSVAITLTNLDGGFRRSMEANWQHKVRSFVQPGEPLPYLPPVLRAIPGVSPR